MSVTFLQFNLLLMFMSPVCLNLFSCELQPLPCVVALSSSLVIVPNCRSCARTAPDNSVLCVLLADKACRVFACKGGYFLLVAALSSLIEICIYSRCCVGHVSSVPGVIWLPKQILIYIYLEIAFTVMLVVLW